MSQFQSQVQQTRDAAQFQLRLPDDLKTRIHDVAEASGRSINSEIVATLLEKYSPAKVGSKAIVDLLRYISDGIDATDHQGRVTEALHFLTQLDPSIRISTSRDGTITIVANPL